MYEDIAISGQSSDRDAYTRLLDEVQQYDAIIVRGLSRFGRSFQQVLNDIDDHHEDGVDLIILNSDINLTTTQGTLFLNIIGTFNQFWPISPASAPTRWSNDDAKRANRSVVRRNSMRTSWTRSTSGVRKG